MVMNRRVVVTGLGAVTSLSCKVEDLWSRILAGESGIRTITSFDTSRFKVDFGGQISDWSTEGYLPAREAKRLDRFAQFAVVASAEAVIDAGLDFSNEEPFRCGVIIGSGIGGLNEVETQLVRLMKRGPEKVSAFTVPKMMANSAAGHVSILHGLKGPNTAVSTACASAANATGDAFNTIRRGCADIMLTGGSEASITPVAVAAFSNMRALSTRNDSPQQASRPFDADRNGFVMAEGAGIFVLEELEHARRRGAKIYAELLGCGASGDGTHITKPDEQGTGATHAMSAALLDAGLTPEKIDYINAHGTSTPLGDKAETIAIKRVFEDHANRLSISSTKSHLGHLLGASGGVELIFCVLALRDAVIPPTINYDTPDPDCDLDYTPNEARGRKINYAMTNSFGFGGHNASLIVGHLT